MQRRPTIVNQLFSLSRGGLPLYPPSKKLHESVSASIQTGHYPCKHRKVYTCLFTRQNEKSSLTKLAPVCFKKNYQREDDPFRCALDPKGKEMHLIRLPDCIHVQLKVN